MTEQEEVAVRELVRQAVKNAHDAGIRTAAEMVRKAGEVPKVIVAMHRNPVVGLESLADAIEASTIKAPGTPA